MKNSFFDYKVFVPGEAEVPEERQMGNNGKKLLILLDPGKDQENIMQFLGKILQAIKYDLQEDCLLLFHPQEEPFILFPFLKENNINNVLFFGYTPQTLGLQFALPLYHSLTHMDISFLRADPIVEIYQERQEGGKAKSGALWNALKELFL